MKKGDRFLIEKFRARNGFEYEIVAYGENGVKDSPVIYHASIDNIHRASSLDIKLIREWLNYRDEK